MILIPVRFNSTFSLIPIHSCISTTTAMSSVCNSENSSSSTPALVPPMDVEMEDVQPTSATFPSSSSAGRVSGHGGISGSYTVGVRPSSKKFKNKHTSGSLNRLQQQTHGLHIDEGFFQRLTPKPFFVGKRFGKHTLDMSHDALKMTRSLTLNFFFIRYLGQSPI